MQKIITAIFGQTFGIIWVYIGLGALLALSYPTLERLGWNQAVVLALLLGIIGVELARAAKNSRERSAKGSNLMDTLVASKTKAQAQTQADRPATAQTALPTGAGMIDHTGVSVADFDSARAFYDAALAPLGYGYLVTVPPVRTNGARVGGYGHARPQFWITEGPAHVPPVHVAFAAGTRVQVDAFRRAALSAGGSDTRAPGPRPHYNEHSYAAFVSDPDGNTIEAVCHTPPPG